MGPDDAPARAIRVEIAYSPAPGRMQRLSLTLPEGATVADALQRSGWSLPAGLRVGVWGRLQVSSEPLRDLDRVELYRPLTVDPKEARRQRYRSHRAPKKP